jgi:diguanylate cyclase (GGDEF)-like protein
MASKDQFDLHVSVSIGLAAYSQANADAEALIGAADAALYRAKRGGRNRVEREAPP